tara:strand:- start:1091 stop:1207 length:117 start_codon:yes stop_codon:yes gene_type:complete
MKRKMEDYSVGFFGGNMLEFLEFLSSKLFDAVRKEVMR